MVRPAGPYLAAGTKQNIIKNQVKDNQETSWTEAQRVKTKGGGGVTPASKLNGRLRPMLPWPTNAVSLSWIFPHYLYLMLHDWAWRRKRWRYTEDPACTTTKEQH